jgi:hypothetical protein
MIKFLLLWVWQFPQNALGYAVSRQWKKRLIILSQKELKYLYGLEKLTGYKIYIADYYSYKADKVLSQLSGFSIGQYICLNSAHDLTTIRHEMGHTKQSQYMGWLYLLAVGIYSALFCNLYNRIWHKHWYPYDRAYWYYKTRWSERWADRLGGVDRDAVLRGMARPWDAHYPAV